jgi:hypothetical protein
MKRRRLDQPVLAEGEVTGHAHRLSAGVEVFEVEGELREFNLSGPGEVKHEEHNPITLPPEEYTSGRVNEFDHPTESAKKVQD